MQNLEIKARLHDRAAIEKALRTLGAVRETTLWQVDTYFSVPEGRLKLRRTEGQADDTLIFYRRPDRTAPKLSDYRLVSVDASQDLAAALAEALGVIVVVHKQRELWRCENVRIHLDEVAGLGSFLEFEAQVSAERDAAFCQGQTADLMRVLGVAAEDLIAGSYSDLLLAAGGHRADS
jgi:adenylate cyclase, class 2